MLKSVLLLTLTGAAVAQMPPNTTTKTYSDTATTTVRVADPDEKIAIGGRIMTVREYMAERERLAKNLAALDRLAELVERVAALEKEVAELRKLVAPDIPPCAVTMNCPAKGAQR